MTLNVVEMEILDDITMHLFLRQRLKTLEPVSKGLAHLSHEGPLVSAV